MTITIDKKLTLTEIKKSIEKMLSNKKQHHLKKHFGLSKDNIDALDFQKKARNEWD